MRKDGKKGIIVQRGDQAREPEIWVDSYVTMGSYSMLAIKDGNKVGLYSQAKGLLVPLQENLVMRYDGASGGVLVTTPDGKTREYREYDEPYDAAQPPSERPANRQDNGFRYEDFFALAYAMINGKTNPAMTSVNPTISKRRF